MGTLLRNALGDERCAYTRALLFGLPHRASASGDVQPSAILGVVVTKERDMNLAELLWLAERGVVDARARLSRSPRCACSLSDASLCSARLERRDRAD